MSAKLPRTVGKPQVYRHLHSSSCVAAKPPKIQPAAPRTAAELGFDKKNADRVPKWEPIDIPFSAQSNIQSGLDRHIRLGTGSNNRKMRRGSRATTQSRRQVDVSVTKDLRSDTPSRIEDMTQATRAAVDTKKEPRRPRVEPVTRPSGSKSKDPTTSSFEEASSGPSASSWPSPSEPRRSMMDHMDPDLFSSIPTTPSPSATNPHPKRSQTSRHRGQQDYDPPQQSSSYPGGSRTDQVSSFRPDQPRSSMTDGGPRSAPRPGGGRGGGIATKRQPKRRGPSGRIDEYEMRLQMKTQQAQMIQMAPEPHVPVLNQSFLGLFGTGSMLNPVIRMNTRARAFKIPGGMSPAEARKAQILRLAGSYDSVVPEMPIPSDPSLTSPSERARSSWLWMQSLQSTVGYNKAKVSQEKLDKLLG